MVPLFPSHSHSYPPTAGRFQTAFPVCLTRHYLRRWSPLHPLALLQPPTDSPRTAWHPSWPSFAATAKSSPRFVPDEPFCNTTAKQFQTFMLLYSSTPPRSSSACTARNREAQTARVLGLFNYTRNSRWTLKLPLKYGVGLGPPRDLEAQRSSHRPFNATALSVASRPLELPLLCSFLR